MSISTPNLYGYPSLFRALAPTGDLPSDVRIWGDANEYLLLDVDFAGNRSLTPTRGVAGTFTRAAGGSATFFDQAGLLQTVGTDVPRFTHFLSGSTWISDGLIIEPASTNSALWSQTLSNAYHAKVGASVTANAGTWLDGTATADVVVEDGTTGAHYGSRPDVVAGVAGAGVTVCVSYFAKMIGRRYVNLDIDNSRAFFAKPVNVTFDLQNGVFVTSNGNAASWGIEPCGNGWYRLWMTSVSTASGNVMCGLFSADAAGNPSITGLNAQAYFADGMQVEINTGPSSYVPTTSATQTRNTEDLLWDGGSFTPIWNQMEGTVAAEFVRSGIAAQGNAFSATDSGNEPNTVIYHYQNGGNNNFGVARAGMSGQADYAFGAAAVAGVATKIAVAYRRNDFAASQNGAAVVTDTSGELPALNRLRAGGYVANRLGGRLRRLRVWGQRLPNATLQALSS